MIDRPTRLLLLGHPVAHSISPSFQNAALRSAGIDLTYEVLDVSPAELGPTMCRLTLERAAGNVTIPHKPAVASLCARLTPLATRVGAVNVFWHEDGELVGDNSDVGGAEAVMIAMLGRRLTGARIALIGAGGSAASILTAAERVGASEVRVHNRHAARANALVSRFAPLGRTESSLERALDGVDLVINATPIGLQGNELPVPIDLLPSGCAVFDLAYRAGETPWVTAARAAGHQATDGLGMLIEQGAIAFERWFGGAPDRNAMWNAVGRPA